ncbi:reverse transcriptase domain-containing protein [Tanacetum coccineum]|uniref:Reverse transcriptase domain-containing protein n=1 Tax=Tanacetum coccineum TaxID=301880 RepID=A0ABQ5AS26_9ASTR
MLFPFSLAGATRRWLEKEPPHSILTWDDIVSKFINEFFPPSRTTNLQNEISTFQQRFGESFHEAWDYKDLLRACHHHGFTKLHQLDTFYNALNPADQDSLNFVAGAKLTHAVNQQTSVVTTAMTTILKQFQATPPPASVKAVEEICFTCGGGHPYYQRLAADGNTFPDFRDNIQGYVAVVAGNYNQGNFDYRPLGVANQTRPSSFVQQNMENNQNRFSQPQGYNRGNNFNQDTSYQAPTQQNQVVPLSELEKIKKINDVNIKAMQAQINNVKNELRNEMQTSIQGSMSNQTNELKNMMASFFQMITTSTSGAGSLPSNTISNPKGELKAITTQSGLVLDGPSVPLPPPFIIQEEDERVEETLTDSKQDEFTIKVPPPFVQKAKPHLQRNYMVHQRDPRHPHIPYPSRMNQEKRQEKDEVQIYKFWQMFKQFHINFSLADALVLIPKYQKLLKSLLSNKEKLLELANTPLNENCSTVIHKKLPEKLGDPRKFLIPCGFSELKCKALADLGIARDVFVLVGKGTFPADFVIVDYESDPRVPLILGRPFLRTACALIDVHGEEMILRDGDERLILNMRHDTSSYSNQPYKESINMIDIYNVSHEEILEDLFATNHLSGNPTSSFTSHINLTLPELIWEEFEAYLASDLFPPGNDDPVDLLLEEFADELALITFPSRNNDLPFDIESDLQEIEYLLNHDPIEEMKFILEDSVDKNSPYDNLVDTISEMFTDEHALDYSSPPLWDDYDDELFDLETVNDNTYYDPFDYKEEKIKDSKILIDELELPRSSDFLPLLECDLVFYEDFPRLILFTNCAKKVKNPPSSNASLILEDFYPPLYELPFHKEVLGLGALLLFSFENKEKNFNPEILTSKGVHTSLLPELSHRDSKSFKVIKIFESPVEIFPCSYGEDNCTLDVPCNGYSLKDKNEAKTDKTEHENGKSVSKSKSKSANLEEEPAPTGETSAPPAPKTAKQLVAKRNQERVKSILLLAYLMNTSSSFKML